MRNSPLFAMKQQVNIEAQRLLLRKLKWKLVYSFRTMCEAGEIRCYFKPNTPGAVTCEDIVVNIPPGQVIPYFHKIKIRQATSVSISLVLEPKNQRIVLEKLIDQASVNTTAFFA